MNTTNIEKRVTALERQISNLAEKVNGSSTTGDMNAWIDQIHGTFQNDAMYKQAARRGQQWRKSQRKASSKPRKSGST